MSPDDPRHGTRAGYQAHTKDNEDPCVPCKRGRARADKLLRIDRDRGVRLEYTAAEVYAVIEPWLAMGLTYGSVGHAAGVGGTHGSRLSDNLRTDTTVRRGTFLALQAVTEDDLNGKSMVYADLTKERIYSLMATGHRLTDMPILATGQWRYRRHISVDQARAIRDYYAGHEHQPGPSANTAGKAIRSGARVPAAWDDPGTLAWPLGWTEPLPAPEVDPIVVERILDGDWRLPCTPADKAEVTRRWHGQGRSLRSLQLLTKWKPERYFKVSQAGEAA